MVCSKCGKKINSGYVMLDGEPVCTDCSAAASGITTEEQNTDIFDNIENKLKITAKIILWLGIAASVIFGFISINDGLHSLDGTYYYLTGIAIIVGGSIASWVVSIAIYSIGRIIENSNNQEK